MAKFTIADLLRDRGGGYLPQTHGRVYDPQDVERTLLDPPTFQTEEGMMGTVDRPAKPPSLFDLFMWWRRNGR
jgi:hypothetical protein